MKTYKIYIVEDMAITRATLINILENNGHTIMGSATTAEKAWLDINDKKPELVLLDFNLKGTKNGIWLADKIKTHLHIPFIFITAYSSDEFLNKITKVEASGYIMKPFNNRTLLANIQLAVSNFMQKETKNTSDKEYLLKTKAGIQKIALNNILYLQSEGNYINIFLENESVVTRFKLDDLITTMNTSSIKKTHLRYAINISKITKIHKQVAFINGLKIPISKSFLPEIISLFSSS